MAQEDRLIQIQTTADSQVLADKLSADLLGQKLAACVKIVPSVTSSYIWKGKTESASEFLLVFTTLANKYDEVEKYILEKHTYEIPEVLSIEIGEISPGYLAWVKEVLR